jgi:hypothetical protein
MGDAPLSLLLDLLDSLSKSPRSYAEVMAAWRTSCPRLPIWEDAVEQNFVRRYLRDGEEPTVELTEAGLAFLRVNRPVPSESASAPTAPDAETR